MGKKEIYFRTKHNLLNDPNICKANQKLFEKFLEFEEHKLKRRNGIKELDEACYKTLSSYPHYLRNVNLWFKNKDWKKLTKSDIQKVYDDLEDEKLKGSSGKLITYKADYYNKIFRSKPFAMVGKRDIAIEVMEFYNGKKKQEVRFFDEQTFKKIVTGTKTAQQRLLCWLAWDFGENIFTLLQLQKKDFVRRIEEETKDPEYILIFPQEKLKRSRTARSELTLYKETLDLLDIALSDLNDDDFIFGFGHRNALKFLRNICKDAKVKTLQGHEITWKDFRSSMCCYLLDQGLTTDEIKARLGHSPSSNVLDKYVNYKALNKRHSKKKIEEGELRLVSAELEEMKLRQKSTIRRIQELESQLTSNLEVMNTVHESISKHQSEALEISRFMYDFEKANLTRKARMLDKRKNKMPEEIYEKLKKEIEELYDAVISTAPPDPKVMKEMKQMIKKYG